MTRNMPVQVVYWWQGGYVVLVRVEDASGREGVERGGDGRVMLWWAPSLPGREEFDGERGERGRVHVHGWCM